MQTNGLMSEAGALSAVYRRSWRLGTSPFTSNYQNISEEAEMSKASEEASQNHTMQNHTMQDRKSAIFDKDVEDLYESGKARRYSLLFAVNGGAYTLAVFLFGLNL